MWGWDSRYSGFYFPKRKPRIPHVGVQSKKLTPSCTGFIFQNGEPKNFIHWGPAVLGFMFQNGQKKISVGQAVDFIFTNNQSMRTITKEEHFSVRRKSMKVEANLSARLNYFRNHRHLFALGIKQKMGIHLYWVSFSKTDKPRYQLLNTEKHMHSFISTPNRQPGVLSSPLFLLETS